MRRRSSETMHIMFQFSSSGAGQQCCYNGDSLMVGPVGGGTLDVASPDENFWGHMGRDVLPWFACCAFSRNCDKYYQRRPSDDGSRYAPPQVGKYFIFPMLSRYCYRWLCSILQSTILII